MNLDRIREAHKPTDPDPEHWLVIFSLFCCVLCRQPLIYIFMSVSLLFDHQIEEIKTETHPFYLAVMLRIEKGMSEPGYLHVF
jgi:hypothetical protein